MSDSLATTLTVNGTETVKAQFADLADTVRDRLNAASTSAQAAGATISDALGNGTATAANLSQAALAKLGAGFDQVARSVDPATAALARLQTQQSKVQAAVDAGVRTQAQADPVLAAAAVRYQTIADATTKQGAAAAGATVAVTAHGSAVGNLSGTYSRLGVEITRAISDFAEGRTAFSVIELKDAAVTLAQTGEGFTILGNIGKAALGALLSPIGLVVAGVTAAAGAIAYLGISAESQDRALNTLGNQLSATRADYSAMAAEATAAAKAVAATTGISGADARTAAQTITSAPDFSGDQAQLQALIVEAGHLATVLGTDVPKAAEILAEALKDPEAEAQKLATGGLPTMGQALVDQIKLLQESGDKAQATALVLKALDDASSHVATDGLTPLQKAVHDLGLEFSGTGTGGETFAHAVGTLITGALAGAISELARFMADLDSAYHYVKSVVVPPVPAAIDDTGNVLLGQVQKDGQRARGIFQINPETGRDLNNQLAAGYDTESGTPPNYDINTQAGNIQAGLTILQNYAKSAGSATGGLARYGGYGTDTAAGAGYIGKVQGANIAQLPTDVADQIAYWGHALGMSDQMIALGQKLAVVESGGRQFTATGASGLATAAPAVSGVSDPFTGAQRSTMNAATTYADSLGLTSDKIDALKAKLNELTAAEAIPNQTPESYAKYSAAIADVKGKLADTITTQQAATRSLEEQANTASSATGYYRALAQVQQQYQDLGRAAGGVDQAALAGALAAKIRELSNAYAEGTDTLQKQLDLQNASIAVYGQGAAAVQHATDYATAYKAAQEDFAKDTPEFNAAVASRTAVLDQLAQVQARGQDLAATHTNDNQLAYIQAETSSLGMNEDARTKLLAVMKAEQAEHDKFGATLPAESQAYLDSVAAIQDATIAYQHQQSSMAELSSFATTAFGDISTAITQAFATGSLKAISFGSIAKGVMSELVSEILKLGVLNPILNTLFGGNGVTLGSVGGVLGSLLGGGTALAASAAGDPFAGAGAGSATEVAKVGTSASSGLLGGSLSQDAGIVGLLGKGASYLFPETTAAIQQTVLTGVNSVLGTSFGGATSAIADGGASAFAGAGTTVAGLAGGAGAAADAAGGAADLFAGAGTTLEAAGTAAASTATAANTAAGALSSAAGAVSSYIPFIGAGIGVLTNVLSGNYLGAAAVGVGAAIGTAILPGIGTAIGATLGEVVSLFLPAKKKNSFESTSVGDSDGFLSLSNNQQQANKDTSNFNNLVSAVASLNTLLASSGTRLAGSNNADMFDVGYGVKGDSNFYDNLGAAFPKLRFGAAANDDTDYTAAINANVGDTSFSGQDTLKTAIDAADALAAHLESLGVTVSSVDKGLAGFTVGSVAGYQNSDLNTALNSDLSGKSFGSTDALDAEVGKVQTFVLQTLPELVSATGDSLSQYQQQQQALDTTYDDAKKTAASYGLSIDALAATQVTLEKKLAQTAVDALAQNEQTYLQRYMAASGNSIGAQLSQLDGQNASEKSALSALFVNYYGTASLTSQDYLTQLNELEKAQGAERVQIVQAYTDQINAAARSIDDTVSSSQTAGLRAQATNQGLPSYSGLNEQADLQDFDASAYDQVQALDKSLVATYGASVLNSQGYATDVVALETSLSQQRLAIQNKYAADALAAQTTAGDTATAAATAAAQAQASASSSAANAIASLTQYAKGLETGSASPLSARDQYALARSQFQADATSAAGGDPTAIGGLSAASDAFLSASRAVNDNGAAYASDFSAVLQAVQGVAALPPDTLTGTFLAQTVQTQTDSLQASLADVKAQLVVLQLALTQALANPLRQAA